MDLILSPFLLPERDCFDYEHLEYVQRCNAETRIMFVGILSVMAVIISVWLYSYYEDWRDGRTTMLATVHAITSRVGQAAGMIVIVLIVVVSPFIVLYCLSPRDPKPSPPHVRPGYTDEGTVFRLERYEREMIEYRRELQEWEERHKKQ